MSWRTLAFVLALLGPACSVPNPNHCGNLAGDATCETRDPARPYCSLCVGANDGCVAAPVVDALCGGVGSTGATTGGGTTAAPTSSGTSTTGLSGMTGGGTSGSTSTTTGAGTSTGTSDASTGASTGVSTDMTSGTASTGGTTEAGPMCGNGELEGMEACDTDQFGGKTCLNFGSEFGGGALKCRANCTIDIANCCKVQGKVCTKGSDCCSGKCLLLCQ